MTAMRYWWVNQNQTYRHEVRGGHLWSPKRKTNLAANPFKFEHACRIAGVNREEHLRASHCKPWRDASNEERLDGENGLFLTLSVDHLFDSGFIAFEDTSQVIVSPVAHRESLLCMGIQPDSPPKVGIFSSRQRRFLQFHGDNVLLKPSFLEHL